MAEAVYEGRKAIRDQYTPALEAAAAIRAAILDDDGPMRHGCEPMSFGHARPVAQRRRTKTCSRAMSGQS